MGIRNDYRGGIKDTKIELTLTLYKEITREDYDSICEYRFVHGNVSLEILMEQSKECIQKLCVN